MEFLNTMLVTLKQPTGFWVNILNSFTGATGTIILSVILVAFLVRLVFAFVEIFNKKASMKSSMKMAGMKNELDAIQKKYGNDQRVMQQKTSEIYSKYKFNPLSSLFPMLLTFALQMTVFFSLWTALQNVSNYNISSQYQNMKNVYANVITLNDIETEDINKAEKQALQNAITAFGENPYTLSAEIDFKNNKFVVTLTEDEENNQTFDFAFNENLSNQEIYGLIEKYVLPKQENEEGTSPEEGTVTSLEYVQDTGFNQIFQELAEKTAKQYYLDTQEGFLWIKNIYRPDSPSSPFFTKSEITKYLSKYYNEDEKQLETTEKFEEKIFDCVTSGINSKEMGSNGYYILTIIAVLTSILSIWLSNKLMKNKNQPANPAGGSKLMYFIMPIFIGIFTMSYTSLFAIYLVIGQIVQTALTPLTTLIVKKWIAADEKREKAKTEVVVDYRRKDK